MFGPVVIENVVIRQDEATQFGCPYCGYRSFSSFVSMGGAACMSCNECRKGFMMVHESLDKLPDGFMTNLTDLEARKVIKHPRHGIPSHGRPDKRPEHFKDARNKAGEIVGGDYFNPRGIGVDSGAGCFVCCKAHDKSYYDNISGFVQTKEAGERVVALFKDTSLGPVNGARLDYRDLSPDRIQVKVTSCQDHLPELRLLQMLVLCAENVITPQIIHSARSYTRLIKTVEGR